MEWAICWLFGFVGLCFWKLKLYIRSIGPSMFEAEALGLGAMYETGTIRVPKPYKVRRFYSLWSTYTDTEAGHDTNTLIIISEHEMIECNNISRCHMSLYVGHAFNLNWQCYIVSSSELWMNQEDTVFASLLVGNWGNILIGFVGWIATVWWFFHHYGIHRIWRIKRSGESIRK